MASSSSSDRGLLRSSISLSSLKACTDIACALQSTWESYSTCPAAFTPDNALLRTHKLSHSSSAFRSPVFRLPSAHRLCCTQGRQLAGGLQEYCQQALPHRCFSASHTRKLGDQDAIQCEGDPSPDAALQ